MNQPDPFKTLNDIKERLAPPPAHRRTMTPPRMAMSEAQFFHLPHAAKICIRSGAIGTVIKDECESTFCRTIEWEDGTKSEIIGKASSVLDDLRRRGRIEQHPLKSLPTLDLTAMADQSTAARMSALVKFGSDCGLDNIEISTAQFDDRNLNVMIRAYPHGRAMRYQVVIPLLEIELIKDPLLFEQSVAIGIVHLFAKNAE